MGDIQVYNNIPEVDPVARYNQRVQNLIASGRGRPINNRVTVRKFGGSQDPNAFPNEDFNKVIMVTNSQGRTYFMHEYTGLLFDPSTNKFIIGEEEVKIFRPGVSRGILNAASKLISQVYGYVTGEDLYKIGLIERKKLARKKLAGSSVSQNYMKKKKNLEKRMSIFKQRVSDGTAPPERRLDASRQITSIKRQMQQAIAEESSRLESVMNNNNLKRTNLTVMNAIKKLMSSPTPKANSEEPPVPPLKRRRNVAPSKLGLNLRTVFSEQPVGKESARQALNRWVKRTGINLPTTKNGINEYLGKLKSANINISNYGLRSYKRMRQ